MRLFDAAWAPSPRRVRIFLAEKGTTVDREMVDLRANGHLAADYLAVAPRGMVPVLQLEDGEVIDESVAICRYFEALHPEPALFGTIAIEIARIESWTRQIESDGYNAAVYCLRNTRAIFADRGLAGHWSAIRQIPELAERGRIMWNGLISRLDARLAQVPWIAGDGFSFADITGLVTIDFAAAANLDLPEQCPHVRRRHAALRTRASASA